MKLRRALAALVVVAGAVGAWPGEAPAQTTGQSTVRLASQTPWVRAGEDFVLRLLIETDQPADEVEVVVAVYRGLTNRTEFTRTLEARPRFVPLTVTPATPLSELPPDAGGAVLVQMPVQDPAQPVDRARLRLDDYGVYPVRVELRRVGGGPPLASLVTHLVYAAPPREGGSPLSVGLVLPVHAPPALQPDGARRLPAAASAQLAALAQALAVPTGVAVTLLPTPETLEALETSSRETDRATLAALAAATADRQVAVRPYVPVNVVALDQAGLHGEAVAQLDRGNAVVERTLGVRPDARTWVADDPLDQAALGRLRALQVDRLVVPEAALVPVDLDVTLTQPFSLEAPGVRRPEAFAGDAGLARHFAPTDDPVLAAHHLLADLTVIYRDQPSRARAVVVAPPRSWQPTTAFVDTLLGGLAGSPVLVAATLNTIFAEAPPATDERGSPMVRRLAPLGPSRALPASEVRDARRNLSAFGSMLKADNPMDDALEAVLLVSQASDLKPGRQRDYLEGIQRTIREQAGLIELPASRSVTLTARRGEIPITVLSRAGYAVVLQIEVASEKLGFPGGATRAIELSRRNTTELFSVEARTSGAFPLRLTLTTPDGGLLLGTSRFTVRSTAASGVGVVLSAGAGLFLVVWWARHLARGRRNRRLVPA